MRMHGFKKHVGRCARELEPRAGLYPELGAPVGLARRRPHHPGQGGRAVAETEERSLDNFFTKRDKKKKERSNQAASAAGGAGGSSGATDSAGGGAGVGTRPGDSGTAGLGATGPGAATKVVTKEEDE